MIITATEKTRLCLDHAIWVHVERSTRGTPPWIATCFVSGVCGAGGSLTEALQNLLHELVYAWESRLVQHRNPFDGWAHDHYWHNLWRIVHWGTPFDTSSGVAPEREIVIAATVTIDSEGARLETHAAWQDLPKNRERTAP